MRRCSPWRGRPRFARLRPRKEKGLRRNDTTHAKHFKGYKALPIRGGAVDKQIRWWLCRYEAEPFQEFVLAIRKYLYGDKKALCYA